MRPLPEAASTGMAVRNRLLRVVVVTGCASLVLLATALVWNEHAEILRSLESGSVTRRLAATADLAERHSSLATGVAVLLEGQARDRSGGRALRVERRAGQDAVELIASDTESGLAVGGVFALQASTGEPAGQPRAITEMLTALPAQRRVLDGETDVEAIYIAVAPAHVVSRVPYVNADQLRLRQRDARLAEWFERDVLGSLATDRNAVTDEPFVSRDPATGAAVLRVDQPAWLPARATPATVIVTVPLRSYLERLTDRRAEVAAVAGLIARDGSVASTASDAAGERTLSLSPLPHGLESRVATLSPQFRAAGSWYALSRPVPGTRLDALFAVRRSDVLMLTLQRSGPELAFVLLCTVALGLLYWIVRRRVVEPADRAVADLMDAESLVREITDGVPGLAVFKVVRTDAGETSVEFVSRGAAAVLGVPAVAIAADWEHVYDTVVSDDASSVRATCDRSLLECAPWQQEFRVRRRDEDRWVRVEARANRVGSAVELVGSWRDVTESREHTELLADAHRRLIELADGVPGAVIQWRVTSDGRHQVAFVGNRLPEIAGIGTSDLYAGLHAFEQVQIAEDVEQVRRARQDAVNANAGYAVEYRVMHPGRGLRWLREEAVSHPIAGCLAAFTVHISDVTQQRKEAGELRRAKEEAEMATRAKSVFLATMSHEIRTPMTGISGMIEVLARTVLDADQRQQLATIADSARTLRRILDDVLDFSRIEAGKMTVEHRPLSIDDVVESTAGLYAAAAEEKGVRLRAMVDPKVGELLMGDAVRLRQVLGNLVSNAVKFTARGSVRLAVVQEALTETHRVLRFEVTDTGAGIPDDVQSRLFAPFERGEREITTQVGGTGLGLALVRRIVELMGGTVELRSLPNVGTAVQVRISFERLHEETSDSRIWLTGLHVAVLHENEVDARFLSTLLEQRGAAVSMVTPDQVAGVPEGTPADVVVTGPDVPREVQHALRARVAAGPSGRTQVVRLLEGGAIRPEVRGDGGVTIAPHARRSAFLRAVAIAAGRDEPDLPTSSSDPRSASAPQVVTVDEAIAERRLILVCEDHPIAQRVIEKQLRVLGYTAELHGNGHSGFTAWRTGRYGLVLTDLQMPEMDGLSLARRIRAEEGRDPTLGRTPIIALSGNAFDEQRVVCVEAGMDDFLAKPALLKELDATLRFWLPPSARPVDAREKDSASTPMPVTLPAPLSHKALKESLGDDPDVLRQALGEFLAADADDFATLYAAVEIDDRAQVVSSAHRIEGAARMLGAMPYARAAERVKRLFGLDQGAEERVDAVHRLQQEGERLRTWLHTTRDWFERVAVGSAI
ncbi:MAG: response regulator [Gemmatimonadales bacterium]|nr:response regulator [Gemmatimonadota bacterium]MCL4214708.1 response regulator [Gemmatimonadales bacterium]